MSDPFEKIGHELDKYFGLGPLFGLADEDEEKRKRAAGTNRGQWTQEKTTDNYGLGSDPVVKSGKSEGREKADHGIAKSAGVGAAVLKATGIMTTPPVKSGAPSQSDVFKHPMGGVSGSASGIYKSALMLIERMDEDEEKKSSGGGGAASANLGKSMTANSLNAGRSAKSGAARAAVAAGGQPAVFKVISTQSTAGNARALIEYLGRREGEDGKKHDIAIETEDGRQLTNSSERRDYLEEFAGSFRDPFTNYNFMEIELSVQGPVEDKAVHEALSTAFGASPFIFARSGSAVRAYGYTEAKSADINKGLALREQGKSNAPLDKIEKRFSDALAQEGITGGATVKASNGTERAGKYFLQKFMRNNTGIRDHAGDEVKVAKRVDKSADRVFAGWKPLFNTREVRNAYHLLFSARAGTDADAVLSSAKAVLDELAPGHKFVVAHHPETGHVHVHAMVSAVSETGERLNFRKADLYKWRETYAEKMQERGIEMVATNRMDMASSRPFNMRQAGAVARNQKDSRYRISEGTKQRVSAKREQIIEPKTAVANGNGIAAGWRDTAAVLYGLNAAPASIERAQGFANVVLSFDSRSTGKGSSASIQQHKPATRLQDATKTTDFMKMPEMQAVFKLVGEIAMAQTPLEINEKISEANASMDNIRKTLPQSEQVRFDELRDQLKDQMRERLAQAHIEKNGGQVQAVQKDSGQSTSDDAAKRGSRIMRELVEARASLNYYQNQDTARNLTAGEGQRNYQNDLADASRRAGVALSAAVAEAQNGNGYILETAKNDPELQKAIEAARDQRTGPVQALPRAEREARERFGNDAVDRGMRVVNELTAARENLDLYRNQDSARNSTDEAKKASYQNDLQQADRRVAAATKAVIAEADKGNKFVQDIARRDAELQKAVDPSGPRGEKERPASAKEETKAKETRDNGRTAQEKAAEANKQKTKAAQKQNLKTQRSQERDYER